jgi:hypothetical protein
MVGPFAQSTRTFTGSASHGSMLMLSAPVVRSSVARRGNLSRQIVPEPPQAGIRQQLPVVTSSLKNACVGRCSEPFVICH